MRFISSHRKALALFAALFTLLSILGGTWAWKDHSQHKTNIATGDGSTALQDVVLIEDYEQPDEWNTDETLTKKVWVKNSGEGKVFIRMQLKEFMDVAQVDYTYTSEYLLVHSDGSFAAADTAANLKVWLTANYPRLIINDAQIKQYKAYNDTAARYYYATDENTRYNGLYGKKMILSYAAAGAKTSLVPGVTRAAYNPDRAAHAAGECLYTPHRWNSAAADPFHQYVEWALGTQVVKLSNWDGTAAAKWILDDSSTEGWAYWGQELNPGEATAKLLESITLIQSPAGAFYYAVHVDMDAADSTDVTAAFTGAPAKVLTAYGITPAQP